MQAEKPAKKIHGRKLPLPPSSPTKKLHASLHSVK